MKTGGKVDPYTVLPGLLPVGRQGPDRSGEASRKTVRDLNRIGRPREVHAALIGYLENHSKAGRALDV